MTQGRRALHPRRILMTADAVGGIWHYAVTLAGELERSGIEVMLARLGPPRTRSAHATDALPPNVTLFESDHALDWMDDGQAQIGRANAWLQDLADSWSPDLVHLNHFGPGIATWSVPAVLVAHSCVQSWWRACRAEPLPASWRDYVERVAIAVHQADALVAPTQAFLDEIGRLYGPPRTGRVIHNGCVAAPARPRSGGGDFIISVGRLWDEAKNLQTLGRASRDVRWPIVVAGDFRSPDGGEAAPTELVQLGPTPPAELAQLLQQASIYVHPARYEPFGLAPLEAAAAGCALVLADIATLRELWNGAAVFVDPSDPAALAQCLNRLCGDPALRDRLGMLARARARRYTARRTADAYLKLYAALMLRRAPATPSPLAEAAE